jgi:hypothetical protein
MSFDGQLSDRLEELHELNRLFLAYLQARAREGQPCLGLPRGVVACLRDAEPEALDQIATLPTALFRLQLDPVAGLAESIPTPSSALARMQLSLVLTILNNARYLARTRPFEARLFLHLSVYQLRRLRALPLSRLTAMAGARGVLRCAFADAQLTWTALLRSRSADASRMLILIALQPNVAPPQADVRHGARRQLRSSH